MDQKPSGFGQGRPPIFTEAKALVVLKNRILAGSGTRLREFIEGEAAEGNLPADVSAPTMQNLLTGRMFPNLVDPETNEKFDYSKIPHAAPGRPSRFNEDGIDPVTKERRRGIPPLRQWLLDKTLEEARGVIEKRVVFHFTQARRELDVQLDALRREELSKAVVDLQRWKCEHLQEEIDRAARAKLPTYD